MAIRIDEQGRGHVESRRFGGPAVAIGLCVAIAIFAAIAWTIHQSNLRTRDRTRRAVEAAEAAETAGAAQAAPPPR